MRQAVVCSVWAVCLVVGEVAAQYGPPPTKGKKHRTTTTTTETPGAISNEISGPFPLPDSGSYSFSSSSAGASSGPGGTVVSGSNYWWQGPDSPFKPGSQPPSGCGSADCGPRPPPPSPGGCGGPAGCTGVGTDPRPQPPSKPVDIAQNPFLSSAILGKPIPQSPQGCQGPGGSCQYPSGQQGSGPTPFPGQGPSQYPSQPTGQYPGQPTGPTQYPGGPGSSGQPTDSSPLQGQGPTQYPGQSTGQYPGQPTGPTQYPGGLEGSGKPTGSSPFPGQGPTQYPSQPTGQYPGGPGGPGKPTGSSPFPGQGPTQFPGGPGGPGKPTDSSPFPGQGPTQYPGGPGGPGKPTGSSPFPGQGPTQYPGQPTGPTYYPGGPGSPSKPTGSSPFPGQGPTQYPSQPTGQYPGQNAGPTQYPGGPGGPGKPTGSSPFPGQGPTQYPSSPVSPNQPAGPSQFPQPTGQYPGQPSSSSQPTGQYPGQPSGQYPGQPTSQYPGQPSSQYPRQPSSPSQPGVPLRPQCAVAGHACVPSNLCVGGVITPNGMRQMRDPKIKECIPGLEACCKLPPGSIVGGSASPRPDYGPVTSQRPYTGPLNTTPYPGCAAALKCVAESYCTAEGVMSDTPVILTREQAENKVPLTDCQNLETGIIGKCCRDPNYKDPWPGGMMMMKNPGGFDDGQYHGEGSGPGFNVAPNYNTISSTPNTPAKDHGLKPSGGPGGFNKPFPPPFPGNNPNNPSFNPGRPQPSGPYQPGKPTPSGTPYQPGQPTPGSPYQPGQGEGSPYQPGQPSPTGPSYQPGQPKPSGTPYQPGQPGSYQPGQPSGTPYQPGQPSSAPNQPGKPSGSPFQPGQPSPTGPSYQPGPSGSPFQPGLPNPTGPSYQPGQPTGTPYQPGQPTGSSYQPGQPIPSGTPSQPDFSGQQPDYNLPTHPGQNQPSGPAPQDQGPAPGSSCGIRRPGPGGDVAGFAEFPWQALIVSAGNRSLLCGAAIIADNAVITAAHCVNQLQAKDLLVKAGEWKLLSQNPKPVQVRPVAAIARHPGYDSGSLAKDLAILVLAQPFTLDTHVDKICIPPELGSEYFQKPGQNCLITGWGKNALQGPAQGSDLHKVDVNVIPAKQCEAKLKTSQNLGKYFILNEGFSCALPPSPTDLCKVDFGSAVACVRGDGHYELAGVNSWDIACPTKQPLPSVFATSDAQWINTVLATPLPVIQAEESTYNQSLLQGESVDGVDTDDKPGFSQGYGK